MLALLFLQRLWRHFPVAGLLTQPDRPRGRRQARRPLPIASWAEEAGLEVWKPTQLREPAFLRNLKKYDILLVFSFGRILPQEVLDAFFPYCWNLHPSLLPRYRGPAPLVRCLMDGAPETGVTLIRMTAEVDAGPILGQMRLPIGVNDTREDLFLPLVEAGLQLVSDAYRRATSGLPLPERPQAGDGTYAPKVRKEERRIPWKESAWKVHNRIRALVPDMPAFTEFRGRRVLVWRSEWCDPPPFTGPPGSLFWKDGLWVHCQDRPLKLLTLQTEGKRRLPADEWYRGARIREDDAFV